MDNVPVDVAPAPKIEKKRRLSKKVLLIILVLIVILVGAGLWFLKTLKSQEPSMEDKIKTLPTKEFQGKQVKDATSLFQTEIEQNTKPLPSKEAQIETYNKENTGKTDTSDYYYGLAQIYYLNADIPNAVKNYELAKTKADPKRADYSSYIATLDKIISSLKARG